MILYIDGKPAALKKGTSFEFNTENRLFTSRDEYTLNIELPLGCAENDAIFGNVNRKDVDVNKIYFDAEIICDNFKTHGAAVITSITNEMVKVQYIAGRSFQNFYPEWDEAYIDKIELPYMPNWKPNNAGAQTGGTVTNGRPRPGNLDPDNVTSETKTPAQAWGQNDIIALPWVNNTSGNMQNRADYYGGSYIWHVTKEDDDDTEVVSRLSCQIRLYALFEMICTAMGYTLDAEDWEESEWYNLYSLNTIPSAWGVGRWNQTLPHWTINELIEQIEKLMLCEIEVRHDTKTVSFRWSEDITADAGSRALDNIVDEYSRAISKNDESNYRQCQNTGYAKQSYGLWNIYSCYKAFRKKYWATYSFSTLSAMIDAVENDTVFGSGGSVRKRGAKSANVVLYAEDVDTYFVMYAIARIKTGAQVGGEDAYETAYQIMPLNTMGDRIVDEENWEQKEEINIVPVWMDDCPLSGEYQSHQGKVIFQDLGELENESDSGEWYTYGRAPGSEQVPLSTILQGSVVNHLINDDYEKDGYTFSGIQVGFWFGMNANIEPELPRPWIDEFDFKTRWSLVHQKLVQGFDVVYSGHEASLRINNDEYGNGVKYAQDIKIDNKVKYEISFLTDEMPNVRSIFIIRGKRYLCSNIKAEINENGMSQLKKGTFFRILE